ncbi:protein sidekick-1-like [Arapaima gigas]
MLSGEEQNTRGFVGGSGSERISDSPAFTDEIGAAASPLSTVLFPLSATEKMRKSRTAPGTVTPPLTEPRSREDERVPVRSTAAGAEQSEGGGGGAHSRAGDARGAAGGARSSGGGTTEVAPPADCYAFAGHTAAVEAEVTAVSRLSESARVGVKKCPMGRRRKLAMSVWTWWGFLSLASHVPTAVAQGERRLFPPRLRALLVLSDRPPLAALCCLTSYSDK